MSALVSPFRPLGDWLDDSDYVDNPIQTIIYFPKLAVFAKANAIHCATYIPADTHGPIGQTCLDESIGNGIILNLSKRSNSSFLCLVAMVKNDDHEALTALEVFKSKPLLGFKCSDVDSNDFSTLERLLVSGSMYTAYSVYSVTDTHCALLYTKPTARPLLTALAVEGTPFIAVTALSKDASTNDITYAFSFECLLDTDGEGQLVSVRTVKQKPGDAVNFVDTTLYPAINLMSGRPCIASNSPATSVKEFIKQVTSRNSRATSDVLYRISAVHLDSTGKTVYYREYDLKSSSLRITPLPDPPKTDRHRPIDKINYDVTLKSFSPTVHLSRTLISHSSSSVIRISSMVLPYIQNSLFNDKYCIITEQGEFQLYSRKEQTDKAAASIRVFPKGSKRAFVVPLRDGVSMITSCTGETVLVGIEGKWNSDRNIEDMRCHLCKLFIDEYTAANPDCNQQDIRDQLSVQLLPPLDLLTKPTSAANQVEKLTIFGSFSYAPSITCVSVTPDYRLVCFGLTKERFAFIPVEPLKNRFLLFSYRARLEKEIIANVHGYRSRYDIESAMKKTIEYFSQENINTQQMERRVNLFFAFAKDSSGADFLPVQESALDSANHHQDAPGETIEMLSILASITKEEPVGRSSLAAFDPALGKSIIQDIKETMRSTLRTVAVPTVGSTALPGEGAPSLVSDMSCASNLKPEQLGVSSKRVEFVESAVPSVLQAKPPTSVMDKMSIKDLSAIESRSQTDCDIITAIAPIRTASGLYRTGQFPQVDNQQLVDIDQEIEDTFRENLISATRDLLESGFNCEPIFAAAEENLRTMKASFINMSDLKTDISTDRVSVIPYPYTRTADIAPKAQEIFTEYPDEHVATVSTSFVSIVWSQSVLQRMIAADNDRLTATFPVIKNLHSANTLLQHYLEMKSKGHKLAKNRFIPALELLLSDDPFFVAASCSNKTTTCLKNSYYQTEYSRKDHEELSQCPYSSLFLIQCNVFWLSSDGETVHRMSGRLFGEPLDNLHGAQTDPGANTVTGIQSFIDRIYSEDFSDAYLGERREQLAKVQYTRLPSRLITFISHGKLAKNLLFPRSNDMGAGNLQPVEYELIGTISSDCTMVYKLDAVGRWCALEGSDLSMLRVSVRANDVTDNSYYAVYKQADIANANVVVPLDSLDNLMLLVKETINANSPSVSVDLPGNALDSANLKTEVSTLRSQLEYRTKREERAVQKVEDLLIENHSLKQRITTLEVDLKYEETIRKSTANQLQSSTDIANDDKNVDEILRLQTELRKREGEERILILELENARRRLTDLTQAQETADLDEYDIILKHCFKILGGADEDVPGRRRELLLALQKQCISVATEYDLNNAHRRDSIRLSYGPGKASQMRMSKSRADVRSLVQSLETFQTSEFQENYLGNKRVIATTLLPVVCFFIGIAIIVVFAIAFNKNDVI